MNYFYKTGLSSIDYYSTEQKITLRDEHDVVRIAQAPFERIIKAWRDGRPTCWNASSTAPGWRLYDEGVIIECYRKITYILFGSPKMIGRRLFRHIINLPSRCLRLSLAA